MLWISIPLGVHYQFIFKLPCHATFTHLLDLFPLERTWFWAAYRRYPVAAFISSFFLPKLLKHEGNVVGSCICALVFLFLQRHLIVFILLLWYCSFSSFHWTWILPWLSASLPCVYRCAPHVSWVEAAVAMLCPSFRVMFNLTEVADMGDLSRIHSFLCFAWLVGG